MLVFTIHAGIYNSCWYLRFMLVFTLHGGIYDSWWYLRFMVVFTIHGGIYDSWWYLRFKLVFMQVIMSHSVIVYIQLVDYTNLMK